MAWTFYDNNGTLLQGTADNAVSTGKIADDAVTTAKIAAGAVGTTDIANDAVTGAKLNPSLVAGDLIYADGTDTITRLAKGAASTTLKMNSGASAPEWVALGAGVGLGMVIALGG